MRAEYRNLVIFIVFPGLHDTHSIHPNQISEKTFTCAMVSQLGYAVKDCTKEKSACLMEGACDIE